MLLRLALCSLWNRRSTAFLNVLAIALSVSLLLGVERLSSGVRESFYNTISGTDLLVGARGGPLQLLLYSVFRMGTPTNNLSWESYQELAAHPAVAWTVPLSLGDSHRGYRVLGTNQDYFRHYRYGRQENLRFAVGQAFDDVFDAVLGAEVAAQLDYHLGQEIIISHGVAAGFQDHDDKPFRVVGILAPTGTPVDRTVHVSLAGIEAIHIDWQEGAPPRPGQAMPAELVRHLDLTPSAITAFAVGLESRLGIFHFQRLVNSYRAEPLMAILPGVTLQELWSLMAVADKALSLIAGFVVLAGLLGMVAVILATLSERRREMAILRAVGARPWQIFALLVIEALLLACLGCLLGLMSLYALLIGLSPWMAQWAGLFITAQAPGMYDAMVTGAVLVAALVLSAWPAWRAYQQSLADGLTVRV